MIEGYDKLLAQFENIEGLDWVSAEVEGINVIANEAKAIVPVDTGALRESIRVEYGTSKMAAQPYMRPAIDNKQRECLKAIAGNLNKQLKAISNG